MWLKFQSVKAQILVEISPWTSQPIKRLGFGKWCCAINMSYLTKHTPELHWVTTWGYILGLWINYWSIRDKDKPIFMVKILSLPIVLAVSSPVSPFQKSGCFKGGWPNTCKFSVLAQDVCMVGLATPSS